MRAFLPIRTLRPLVRVALALALLPAFPSSAWSQRSVETRSPSIRSASPLAVTAVVGERPVSVKLSGAGLDGLSGAAVVAFGKTVPDVRASLLRSSSGSERTIEIAAGERAPAGTYELVVTSLDASRRTQTLATKVSVTIGKGAEPDPVLEGLGLAASKVGAGSRVSGKVTLDRAAPTEGTTVHLASTDPGVASPSRSQVTVSAGQTVATFEVDAQDVAEDRSVTLSASLAGVERTAVLTVEAPIPAVTVGSSFPTSLAVEPGIPLEVTVTGGGFTTVTEAHAERAGAPAPDVSVTWNPQDDAVARFTVTASLDAPPGSDYAIVVSSAGGTQELPLPMEVMPAPEQPRVIAVHPDGMIFTQTPTTTQGSVDIHVPAPAGGTEIALSTNRSDLVSLPASVTVPEGQTSTTFTVSIGPISTETPGATADPACGVCVSGLHVVASDGAETMVGSFGANGPDGAVVGDVILPAQVTGGAAFEATVHLNVQPQSPVTLDFNLSGPGSTVPQLVVPAGQQDATFTVQTTSVAQPTSLQITARSFDYEITGTTRTLEVLPVVNELEDVRMQHADFWVDPGPDNRVIVRLTTGSAVDRWVRLESSDPRVVLVDSVLISGGGTRVRDVPMELTSAPTESFPVTITARAGDSEATVEATAHPLPRVDAVLFDGSPDHTVSTPGEVTAIVSLTSIGPEELPVRIEVRGSDGLASDRATVVVAPVIPAGASEATFTITVPEGEPAELEIRAVLHSLYLQTGGFMNSQASATLHVGG